LAFTDLPEGFSVATRVEYFLIRNSTSGWLFDTSKGCIQYRRVPRIRSRWVSGSDGGRHFYGR